MILWYVLVKDYIKLLFLKLLFLIDGHFGSMQGGWVGPHFSWNTVFFPFRHGLFGVFLLWNWNLYKCKVSSGWKDLHVNIFSHWLALLHLIDLPSQTIYVLACSHPHWCQVPNNDTISLSVQFANFRYLWSPVFLLCPCESPLQGEQNEQRSD